VGLVSVSFERRLFVRRSGAVFLLLGASACHDGASPPANTSTAAAVGPAAEGGVLTGGSEPLQDAEPHGNAGDSDVAGGADFDASSAANSGSVVVTADDDGKTFDVAVGGALVFALARNAGTGYVWKAGPLEGSALVQDGDRRSETHSDVPGAPKRDVYRFVAKSAGTVVIEMALKRPFGSAPAGRTLRVTVRVR
jgi:predicted secreted protein